jgi:hypothetical protein
MPAIQKLHIFRYLLKQFPKITFCIQYFFTNKVFSGKSFLFTFSLLWNRMHDPDFLDSLYPKFNSFFENGWSSKERFKTSRRNYTARISIIFTFMCYLNALKWRSMHCKLLEVDRVWQKKMKSILSAQKIMKSR